ncbi:MAG: hypothetical protein H0Z28_06130 [Archaeoglobus sp.]|nr:hypothetical protein [Archaeoglobus sp.]
MKYLNRIYDEADREFLKPLYRNLPFIEAVAVMLIISRAMAESIEIFPYSVSKAIVSLADKWAYAIAPLVDKIYGFFGYAFSPDVALMHRMPAENPIYPLPVWMISLWSFSVAYTLFYWFSLTSITYGIGRLFGRNGINEGSGRSGSFVRLLTWTGIAHIPMINWWFYVGCEMLYEIVRQEMYLGLTPPYTVSAVETSVPTPLGSLPNFVPVEGFWFGYGIGVAFLMLTILLIYGFVKRELGLDPLRTLIAILPWIAYFGFLLVGSLNVNEITGVLNAYVEQGKAWRWFR